MTKKLALSALLALSSVGCVSTFTHIERLDDKNYFVTSTTQGAFKVSGTLYKCEADGKRMVCTEVASE